MSSDALFLEIQVDGHEIAHHAGVVNSVALTEGSGTFFPACLLNLNDIDGFLTKDLALVDGAELTVTVGLNKSDVNTVTRQYRVFGHKAPSSGAGNTFKLAGIYDAPGYTMSSERESYKGSSAKVIEEIAKKCKLAYEGPGKETKDEQVWLNICKTRSAFVNEITRHGFIDETSAMSSSLSSLGILKYKNFMELIEDTPKFTLSHNTIPAGIVGTGYLVREAKSSSSAGMTNSWQNYGFTKVSHNLSGKYDIEKKLDVNTTAKHLSINAEVAKTVKNSRVEYSKLDCSNVHEKYERAKYQNIRMLALFSEKTSVMLLETTDIQIFDTVLYKQSDQLLYEPSTFTDNYIVIGKTVYVKNGRIYAERLELVRMSVNNTGQSKLATQSPSTLRLAAGVDSVSNPYLSFSSAAFSVASSIQSAFSFIQAPVSQAMAALGGLASSLASALPGLTSMSNLVATGTAASNAPQVSDLLRNSLIPNTAGTISSLQLFNSTYRGDTGINNSMLTAYTQSVAYATPNSPYFKNFTTQQQGIVQRQIPTLTTQALFAPGGAVDGLSLGFPALATVANACRVYNTINASLKADSGSYHPEDISEFDAQVTALNTEHEQLNTNLQTTWNNSIAISNMETHTTNVQPGPYIDSDHLDEFLRLSNESIVWVRSSTSALPISESSQKFSRIVQVRDDNGDLKYVALQKLSGEANLAHDVGPVALSSLTTETTFLTANVIKLTRVPSENTLT